MTSLVFHHGLAPERQAARQEVPVLALLEHPERFVLRRPMPPTLREAVYINPPRKQTLNADPSTLNS